MLCDILNPLSDTKSELVKGGAIALRRVKNNHFYKIESIGHAEKILQLYKLKRSVTIYNFQKYLAMPSFLDLHFHWVQDDVTLMPKDSLLSWLSKYTWPNEAKFKKKTYSKQKAKQFCNKLLQMGTLGGGCFASIHEHTVDHALEQFHGDFVVGNVLMTINSPDYLTQSSQNAVEIVRSKSKKYGKKYAITPRFAPTVDPHTMKETAKIAAKSGCFIQSHLCETQEEIEYVLSIYNKFKGFESINSYTEIYNACGLLGPKTIMAHGIYLNSSELKTLKKTNTAIAHCPTSNAPTKDLGLGSGLFDFKKIEKAGICWGLGSDIGGGPYLSMFDVMRSFVLQNKKIGTKVSCSKALYRATLKNAQILGLDKTCGNLSPNKHANIIMIESPHTSSSDTAESVLERVLLKNIKSRHNFSKLVKKTIYRGKCWEFD